MIRINLNKSESLETRKIIYEKTGFFIKSSVVLDQIFRRSSLAAEIGEYSNEIFEFIGDKVLSYYIVKFVSERCGSLSLSKAYSFRINENRFTSIEQSLINNEMLAKIIDDWDISKYLLLNKSDIKNEVIKEQKVKADLFEAIIGAIAVVSNWNSEIIEKAVVMSLDLESKIDKLIEDDFKVKNFDIDNAVTYLKELAESGQCTMPKYEFTGPENIGYDSNGNPRWISSCTIINDKTGLKKLVESTSKKDAKKAAAYLVLCEQLEVQNKYGPNDWSGFWIYKNGKLYPDR